MSFTLDWAKVDIDGDNALSDGPDNLGVSISTPRNADHPADRWAVGDAVVGDRPTIQSDCVSEPTLIALEFDRAVTDVCFELYDVDASRHWDDKVTIVATNAAGDEVEVAFSDLADTHQVDGNTIEASGNAQRTVDGPGAADSVTVTIAGPVTGVRIIHDNGPDAHESGTVGMSDWSFRVAPLRDGIVSGTEGDDTIIVDDFVDEDGDEIDNEDAILGDDAPNDDRVVARGGDDVIDARLGDDTVQGGDGCDVIEGGLGDDVLYGNEIGNDGIIDDAAFPHPAPDPDPHNDRDKISGGKGNDLIFGQDDRDTLSGGAGDDTLDGGIDDDRISGGAGSDSVIGGQGDDTIVAGLSSAADRPDRGYPPVPGDKDPFNDRDTVDGGLGDDLISTGDDNDVIFGGQGDDTIDAGFDDDHVAGGSGDDEIIAGEGADTVLGGSGDDRIFGGIGDPDDILNVPDSDDEAFPAPDLVPENGRDFLDGGRGDDTIFGEDDDDTIEGGTGNDSLDGGIDDDLVSGGDGRDTLIGGQGVDTLKGGADQDLFLVNADDDGGDAEGGGRVDQIFGGGDGGETDFDTLLVAGVQGTDWRVVDTVTDSDGNGLDGRVEFLDGDGMVSGSLDFENIEIVCFTPGTLIATPKGLRPAQELSAGDRVLTRDNGVQEIAWYGQTGLNAADFAARPHLTPILIRAGALGNGLPERDMTVSPQHRVLIASDMAAIYFDDREVLVAAKHLVNGTSILRRPVPQTTYIHFMCARHEVVLSDGAWTESFQPGDHSLAGIDGGQRREIVELFPELASADGRKGYAAARRSLKRHEAVLLAR